MLDHPATTTLRGAYGLQPIDRLRLVLGVEHVLRLGARVTADLLIETTDDVPHLLRRLDELPAVPAAATTATTTQAPSRNARYLRLIDDFMRLILSLVEQT